MTDKETTFSKAEIKAMRRAAQDEAGVFADFWHRIKNLGRKVPFAEDIVAAAYCATDTATPARVKLMIVGAIAYFVMPIDVVPDFLPLIGLTDDAAILGATIAAVRGHMTEEHRERARVFLETESKA